VMSVPTDFGADAADFEAGQALIGRTSVAIRRIAADGYGALSRRFARLIDMSAVVLVTGGWVLAAVDLTSMIWSAVSTALIGGCRWALRKRLLPWAERAAIGWLRRSIR
jgi:hypothetical protein